MDRLRYTVTYEVDKDILCDQDTIDSEFNGSWQEWLEWFAKEELGEVLMGMDTEPISFTVVAGVETPEERKKRSTK